MKTKKTLILISGILFLISAVSCFMVAMMGLAMISEVIKLIKEELVQYVEVGEMTADYANSMIGLVKGLLIGAIVCMIAAMIVDLTFGILLIRHSKMSDEIVASKKALIITALVFAFLCSGIITAVLLIVALCLKNDPLKAPINNETINNSEYTVTNGNVTQDQVNAEKSETIVNEKYASQIKRIQKLRDSGAITQAEYESLLKKIFED